MPSFDIVSEVNAVELRNSVDNASRELTNRFDFRGVEASFSLAEMVVTMKTESDFQLKQMEDILRGALAARKVDTSAMEVDEKALHSGKTFSRNVKFKQGIEQPTAKKLVKMIKDSKLKVQAQIQGDKLRITGKKRDDLQAVMVLVREAELGQPFQFENFRE
ncbi:YajQ family cyclic di-GMP-binding protein [Ferrimonas futtsuensis]|uniref:YajQ family cyclic di-GMP-binding protein n=1 Tax=Ferrimonas futtsuensis TaxID=364764 RepID=UPI00041265D9|nr:YajQ family cyclic di-GMP-binding protein [Ferrimonas futtsuensis]